MEINIRLRLDVNGDDNSELFNISREDMETLEKEYKTLAILEKSKEALITLLDKYQGDSPKLIWLIFVYAASLQEIADLSFLMEHGSERFIQKQMANHIHLLLNSGASITEIRKLLS